MTHEEALLWLNDRCGKHVSVALQVTSDEASASVLEVEGELCHWREKVKFVGRPEQHSPRKDLEFVATEESPGLYMVGKAGLDVTQLGSCKIRVGRVGDELVFELDDDIRLSVVRPTLGSLELGGGGAMTKSSAIERLREATTNREATLRNIIDEARAEETYEAGRAALEDAAMESQRLRQSIEDVAIGVVGDVYHYRFSYADVVEVVETAGAEWLYAVILDRAVEAVKREEG